jgi:hypothetical protein
MGHPSREIRVGHSDSESVHPSRVIRVGLSDRASPKRRTRTADSDGGLGWRTRMADSDGGPAESYGGLFRHHDRAAGPSYSDEMTGPRPGPGALRSDQATQTLLWCHGDWDARSVDVRPGDSDPAGRVYSLPRHHAGGGCPPFSPAGTPGRERPKSRCIDQYDRTDITLSTVRTCFIHIILSCFYTSYYVVLCKKNVMIFILTN